MKKKNPEIYGMEVRPLGHAYIPHVDSTEYDTLIDWAYKRAPGERIVYHRGPSLEGCNHIRDAQLLIDTGRATAIQRRMGFVLGTFEYILILTKESKR